MSVASPTPADWRRLPATLVLLALSFAGFLLVRLGLPLEWLAKLTYTDFALRGQHLVSLPVEGQYWRLLTPAFLHFGWLHIVFNSLWLWELGGRLELRLGHCALLALVAALAVASNTAQFRAGGPGLFGGMSGVVFGLLGFSLVYSRLAAQPALAVGNGIAGFMLAWLAFCMLAPTEWLGLGSIANAAHLAGLLAGLALGLLAAGARSALGFRS